MLNVRAGEGRVLAVMGAFLLLNTANTTVISAAKNGLFLSVYEPALIPYAVIAAAILTAFVAVVFTGAVAGAKRRSLAIGLTGVLAFSVLVCWVLFHLHHRTAFVVYLWLSAVQVLVLTHAWDYASSLLTGRQAKRLLPLIGLGASIGAIVGGLSVAPATRALRTENLLWIALALVLCSLPVLWLVGEPVKEPDEATPEKSPLVAFAERSGRGLREVARRDLLRLMAFGLVALTIAGTLIDLQLKFLLQDAYERDEITAIYGYLSAGVGLGTLILQLWASRVLFPRFGVSYAALLHGGLLVAAAGGVTAFGGLLMLVFAQALDDVLQFSLQKPVEQVSLLPFPSRVKSVALATLGGVMRPLSKAAGGGIALAFAGVPRALPLATLVSAGAAVAAYTQHRTRYLRALESALARRAVDLSEPSTAPLVVDKSTLSVIDRGLKDADPTIAVFSTSLLEQLPAEEAVPRLVDLLAHGVPEVRSQAARVLGRIEASEGSPVGPALERRLREEPEPEVLAGLLESLGRTGGIELDVVTPYLTYDDERVRHAAIVALGRLDWHGTDDWLRAELSDADSARQALACRAVGDLGRADFIPEVAGLVESAEVRPAALDALAHLGPRAVAVLSDLLRRRSLALSVRRTIVSALAPIDSHRARDALVGLVADPTLGPAALAALSRLRSAGTLSAIDDRALRSALHAEVGRGLLLSAVSTILRRQAEGPRDSFIASELAGLHARAVERVLRLLALAYDPERIGRVGDGILSDNPARRSNALELLEGTVSGLSAREVMPFLDLVAEGMPLERVLARLPRPGAVRRNPAEELLTVDDWWARSLALHHLGRDDEVSSPDTPRHARPEDNHMMPLIEKVMILKGSEFFRRFPGSDLAGIAALTQVVHVTKDEVLFELGDQGDAFYVVVSGAIVISRAGAKLATLGPREGFGEMSILDGEPRSASATAAEDSTLLTLDRDSFDGIIERNPAVARGVYQVLTERLRNTLAQVAPDGSGRG
jgi:HEAT repeat protein